MVFNHGLKSKNQNKNRLAVLGIRVDHIGYCLYDIGLGQKKFKMLKELLR